MSDIQYSVELVYLTKGSLGGANALGHFSQMHGEIGKIDGALSRVGSSFASSFGGAIDSVVSGAVEAAAGIATTVGGALATGMTIATKAGLAFNSQLEMAQISLASIAQANFGGKIDQHLGMAAQVISEAKKDAMRLPGELKDLTGMMASTAPTALRSGFDLPGLEKMNAQAMAAAAALDVPFHIAARQLSRAISGNLTSAMQFPLRLGLDKSINHLPQAERNARIKAALASMSPSIDLFASSGVGLLSSVKDSARGLAATMTAPLYASLKTAMSSGLEWFNAHTPEAEAFATRIGVTLDAAFHRALDFAKHWLPIAEQFGAAIYTGVLHAITLIEPYAARFGAVAERFAKDPNALAKIGDVGAGLLGAKGASEAMGLGGDALASIGRFGPMISAAGIGLGDMAIASGVGAAALAMLAAGGYGAVDILTDSANSFHDSAIESINHIKANTTKIGEAAEKAAPALRSVADAIGAYWIKGLEWWSTAFGVAADAATEKLGNFSGALDLASAAIFGLAHKNEPADRPNFVNGANALVPWFSAMADEAERRHEVAKPPQHSTHIHGGVQIHVNSTQDPSRVARAVADVLLDIHRHPRVSSLNPNNRFVR